MNKFRDNLHMKTRWK